MNLPAGQNQVAQAIAQALIDGFDKHYRLFRM
jgi:isocitrate dehydrogenase kinase/phosphatase